MYRSSKKVRWISFVGWHLLAVVVMIQLAGCGSSSPKALVVTGLTPATVPATGGQIIFSGNNFSFDDKVTIGGVPATVSYGGPTLLTAMAPASSTPGPVNVVVSNLLNGSVTLPNALTYKAAPTQPTPSNAPICSGATCIYQAENPQSTLTGNADIAHCDGCMGGLKIGNLGGPSIVTINDISAPADGTYNLNIFGVDGDSPGYRTMTVAVNGGSTQSVQISGSNWNGTSSSQTVQVQLKKGSSNSIQFGNASDYAPDLDYIVISPNSLATPPPCTSAICVYHGESASNTLFGNGQVAGCSGCSDGFKIVGFDNGYGGVIINNVYAPSAGTYNLMVYGVDGDSPGYRTMSVAVNGGTPNSINISNNNWNASAPGVPLQVSLNQGNNSITISSFLYDYGPGFDYLVVSPQPQLTSIGSGPVQINYDLNTGLASFAYNGATMISNFYSQVMLGGTSVLSTSGSYTRKITFGSNGETDVTLTASDGTPTMVQRFIIVNNNYLLMQVELEGANGVTLSSNSMAPMITSSPGSVDLGSYANTTFLQVPFDNDSFRTYNAGSSNGLNQATSYEVGAFYDNASRNGLVIGSVTHDTWKTAVTVNGSNNRLDSIAVVGGFAAPEDQLPHGAVTGNTIASPMVMVGYYPDWRNGMEAFANANAQNAPMLAWNKPAPTGWSSWGKIQQAMSPNTAIADATYFHEKLPSFTNQGVSYMNLDANGGFTDAASRQFIATAHSQGQKAGIYWVPWAYYGTDMTQTVEGTKYTYGDIVMRDQNGNPLKTIDGAYAVDPTHPGTLQRIDFYYLQFSTNGFDSIKFDFLSHGILEGGSNNGVPYDPAVHTGVQAYNEGMAYLAKKFGATMYMDESISPIFPYQYAHARRVSCDTFGGIGSPTVNSGGTTSYEMNSASYGWWLAGRLYNFNDPDQIVLEGFTSNENKSRVTSTAIQGYMIDGDDLTDTAAPALAQQWLTNSSINGLAALKLNFRPVDGATGQNPTSVLVAQSGNTYYLAVFNYDGSNPLVQSIDLGHAGLSSTANYTVTDLWTGATSNAAGNLSVNLNPAESTIYKLQ
jgi:Alpha galactosidase C-terminal beta sandwich domain